MVDYDPYADEVMRDPHPTYTRLRSESPVHYIAQYDCWARSRFEDVWAVALDAECFSARGGVQRGSALLPRAPAWAISLIRPRHPQVPRRAVCETSLGESSSTNFFESSGISRLTGPAANACTMNSFAATGDFPSCSGHVRLADLLRCLRFAGPAGLSARLKQSSRVERLNLVRAETPADAPRRCVLERGSPTGGWCPSHHGLARRTERYKDRSSS